MSLYKLPNNLMTSKWTGKILDFVRISEGHIVDGFCRFNLEFFEASSHSDRDASLEEWCDIEEENVDKAMQKILSSSQINLISGEVVILDGIVKA